MRLDYKESYDIPSPTLDTVKLKMDAYHDMVAEIGALKIKVNDLTKLLACDATSIQTLRGHNKQLTEQLQAAYADLAALRRTCANLRAARSFKTIKVA